MLNLTELMDIGCAHTVVDSDGWMYPCGKPIVAIRRWPEGDGESFGGVCQRHAVGGKYRCDRGLAAAAAPCDAQGDHRSITRKAAARIRRLYTAMDRPSFCGQRA